MKHTNSIIMTIVALAMLALTAGCMESGTDSGTQTSTSGAAGGGATSGWTGNAKDFTYTTFAGMNGKASDFAGKPLVVNFWAAT